MRGKMSGLVLAFGALLVIMLPVLSPDPVMAGDSGGVAGPNGQAMEKAKQKMERLRAAVAVHQRHVHRLLGIPGVVGSGTALGPEGEPIIRVFTEAPGLQGIPDTLEGVRVRAKVSGRFYALRSDTCDVSGDKVCLTSERWPLPVPIGVSVGHPAITAGTIGARVKDSTNVYVLSNNHVLANVNQASTGDPILQPGTYDGGINPGDRIANLSDFEPIKFCTIWWFWLICDQTNTMDAAIAQSTSGELGAATPMGVLGPSVGYGPPSTLLHPAYGDPSVLGDEDLTQLLGIQVQKHGRTTGLTKGTIDTIRATVDVCYDSSCTKIARFTDQLIITPGTFSAGGDSGSLIVTADGKNQPVGLLFAGSDTNTIANRIDLVLNRFKVTIDDGSAEAPAIDLAIMGIDVPSEIVVHEPTTVTVTVRNIGTEAVASAFVTLKDLTENGTVGTQDVINLAAGASAVLDFPWTPAIDGLHTLQANHELVNDKNIDNNIYQREVNVLPAAPSGPLLRLWQGEAYTNQWTTVQLGYNYGDQMVVVCSPNYDLTARGPALVRVRNAGGSSFEVGLGRPWYGGFNADHFSAKVRCLVVRQGIYSPADHGVKMEAVKLENFATTDRYGSWVGVRKAYQNPAGYAKPVVVGQVVSPDTGTPPSYCPAPSGICAADWSVFWSRGTKATNPPSSTTLYVGRHTGQDPNPRPAETLMYLVIEGGTGTIGGRAYLAGLGGDTIRGMQNKPPFTYSLSGLNSASSAVVSQAGMDGTDGGWAVLYGPNAVSATQLRLAIDEDWYYDSERSHTTEQVAYIVFE